MSLKMKSYDDKTLQNLPGWELVNAGLKDVAQGKYDTVAALLIFMTSPRLRFLGFDIPDYPMDIPTETIHQHLYRLLDKSASDTYSQYNALQRRLASFCRAMELL